MTDTVTLKHVFDPRAPKSQAMKSGRRFYVHAWQNGAPRTLCDLMDVYWEFPGTERTLRVLETSEDINCMACGKSLEVVARQQLKNLSPPGLQKVLDLIAAMRNGDLSEHQS